MVDKNPPANAGDTGSTPSLEGPACHGATGLGTTTIQPVLQLLVGAPRPVLHMTRKGPVKPKHRNGEQTPHRN